MTTAENHGNEWGLTWHLQRGNIHIYQFQLESTDKTD